ncbi:efflux transporter periplasmic adaptor subunit [Rhodoblastus sphagnicola]|uniref:Efflux transporter periplasmic adaptor subunit n=1 Tax=Rhodoblastus sphagnicola TaxID=333368 RepID=A0A2S6MXW9_9HYPH|nr:efflux RND transporter periplasmic adaptor subunit [Rhodoblastus sphagnicola]MBB4196626.1 Cu(I)/Ag(I) efflux system membrane fusion protein [Rhodoblastus sphagnicola]PPQ27206.1 efflux transporter periplasmic adaptor subunit [Rhodoblastus sphagnicola]
MFRTLSLAGAFALAALLCAPAPTRAEPEILFYRDPMGGPDLSKTPKKDAMGMDFLPVRASDLAGRLPALDGAPPPHRKILYYRNPMGLADVSATPKKDAMGMDYIPVTEGDEADSTTIKLSPGKIQRAGVRSEAARLKTLTATLRAPGTIQIDERRQTIVATRSPAFIEKVGEATTGEAVRKGQILFRFYAPDASAAAAQYAANPGYEGARTRLDVLNIPEATIAEIARTHKAPLSIAWPAPHDGVILERNAIEGMKAEAGQTLFRLADLSLVWALVDVAERDAVRLKPGQSVTLFARGAPERKFSGRITVIYPQINRDSRTARVRVELANPDLFLRPDMYVEAEIATEQAKPVVTVPTSAVLDSGLRKIVLVDLGEGRFAPREVRLGRQSEGVTEIGDGLAEGEQVVVTATFLIDSESNLKAALQSLAPEQKP